MAKKLFVGNVPYTASEETLKEHFGAIGNVESATIVTDRETGRSRGFGFVEYTEDADADKAIQELDGKEFDGRPLTVNEARPPRQDN